MEILKPYRARIDALDDQIIDLLAQRMGIIREVGALKAREKIEPVLPDRVEEVRERCARRAGDLGVDADMVRDLYDRLIRHCCELEAEIIKTS